MVDISEDTSNTSEDGREPNYRMQCRYHLRELGGSNTTADHGTYVMLLSVNRTTEHNNGRTNQPNLRYQLVRQIGQGLQERSLQQPKRREYQKQRPRSQESFLHEQWPEMQDPK